MLSHDEIVTVFQNAMAASQSATENLHHAEAIVTAAREAAARADGALALAKTLVNESRLAAERAPAHVQVAPIVLAEPAVPAKIEAERGPSSEPAAFIVR